MADKDTSANGDNDKEDGKSPAAQSFWDSWFALGFLVLAIFMVRWYVAEPYKIPSGSMEPTLVGHEDYGDRIVTNKLAYAPEWRFWVTLGASAALIGFGYAASRSWKSARSTVVGVVLLIGVCGGLFFGWTQNAFAGTPKRFEVVVFEYETGWSSPHEKNVKINYIKRLVGLPGEKIVVNGGDLFWRDGSDKDHIIRKWESAPDVQKHFWYPVAKAWVKNSHRQMSDADKARLAFAWDGASPGTPGAKLAEHALELDGSAPVALNYPYPVTNLHIKQGRWPFRHIDCPATKLPGSKDEHGIVWRNPKNAPSDIVEAYVNHPWQGVQCPQCGKVVFPLSAENCELKPWQPGDEKFNALMRDELEKHNALPEVTKFFYGGNHTVGDLKIDLELEVEKPGRIKLEAGSNVHRAVWEIGGAGAPQNDTASVHPVQVATPALTPGHHTLSLAYLDATVIAYLDGKEIERRALDLAPIGREALSLQSIARVEFDGFKGKVTRLDLFRDQYYLAMLDGNEPNRRAAKHEDFDKERALNVITVPEGMYLMMGDNSPSSSDGRIWGPVPRRNLIGRASFIWWPMSRWRIITHGHGEAHPASAPATAAASAP